MTGNRYVAVYDRPRVEASSVMADALRAQVAAELAETTSAVAEAVVVDLQSVVDAEGQAPTAA